MESWSQRCAWVTKLRWLVCSGYGVPVLAIWPGNTISVRLSVWAHNCRGAFLLRQWECTVQKVIHLQANSVQELLTYSVTWHVFKFTTQCGGFTVVLFASNGEWGLRWTHNILQILKSMCQLPSCLQHSLLLSFTLIFIYYWYFMAFCRVPAFWYLQYVVHFWQWFDCLSCFLLFTKRRCFQGALGVVIFNVLSLLDVIWGVQCGGQIQSLVQLKCQVQEGDSAWLTIQVPVLCSI